MYSVWEIMNWNLKVINHPCRHDFRLRKIELPLGRYFSISTKRWILIREPTRTCAFRSIPIVASRAHGLFPRSEYKRTIFPSFSSPASLVRVSRCFATIYCRLADVPLARVFSCLSLETETLLLDGECRCKSHQGARGFKVPVVESL